MNIELTIQFPDWTVSSGVTPVFEVNGTRVPGGEVPEPAALLLLAAGVGRAVRRRLVARRVRAAGSVSSESRLRTAATGGYAIARPSAPAGVVRRARVILLSAGGASGIDIAVHLDLSPESVSRIRRRFVQAGVDGLLDQPKAGRRDHAVPADTVEHILQLALSPPPAGRSRWTTRLLAEAVGRTSGCVSDILRAHGLKPVRTK